MKIVLEPYYQVVHVKFVRNTREYVKRKFRIDEENEAMTLMEKNIIYVVLPVNAPLSTICHEAFHAVHFCMTHRGVQLDDIGEAYAYLLGKLTETIINKKNGIK